MRLVRLSWLAAAVICAIPALVWGQPGTITTVAGNGTSGMTGDGGPATSAEVGGNGDTVAVDNKGNLLIAETYRVRRVDATSGVITTVAGGGSAFGDGIPATSAFLSPVSVAADPAGNFYVCATSTITKVNSAGIISTVVGNQFSPGYGGDGGPATSASILAHDLAFDSAGNMYIADYNNQRIRKVNAAGIITTIAGNGTAGFSGDGGPATSAMLNYPQGISLDSAGNIYFVDLLSQRVRKIDTSGNISSIAGGNLIGPQYTAVDPAGNVYVGDSGANQIYKIGPGNTLTTYAGGRTNFSLGDGGPATSAQLIMPTSIAFNSSGDLFIADTYHYRIRKVQGSGAAGGAPAISGISNGASFASGVTSNAWATITGTNLSAVTDTWNNAIVGGNLPTTLDGVRVTIGFAPAYIAYVSPTQINFVVPPNLIGSVPVTVTNSSGTSSTFMTNAATYGPGFFTWPNNQPVATRQDYSLAAKSGTFSSATTPAKPGDVLILWGTGFGPTIPAIPPGVEIPTLPNGATYAASGNVAVTINGVSATVYGAAFATGYAGLFQVAIQVPASLANGDWPLVASVGGSQSATTTLTVHN